TQAPSLDQSISSALETGVTEGKLTHKGQVINFSVGSVQSEDLTEPDIAAVAAAVGSKLKGGTQEDLAEARSKSAGGQFGRQNRKDRKQQPVQLTPAKRKAPTDEEQEPPTAKIGALSVAACLGALSMADSPAPTVKPKTRIRPDPLGPVPRKEGRPKKGPPAAAAAMAPSIQPIEIDSDNDEIEVRANFSLDYDFRSLTVVDEKGPNEFTYFLSIDECYMLGIDPTEEHEQFYNEEGLDEEQQYILTRQQKRAIDNHRARITESHLVDYQVEPEEQRKKRLAAHHSAVTYRRVSDKCEPMMALLAKYEADPDSIKCKWQRLQVRGYLFVCCRLDRYFYGRIAPENKPYHKMLLDYDKELKRRCAEGGVEEAALYHAWACASARHATINEIKQAYRMGIEIAQKAIKDAQDCGELSDHDTYEVDHSDSDGEPANSDAEASEEEEDLTDRE
ncbi:MAG TPA: hypothetical protein V6D20_17310, partial [Candidatus Obscuribacterales bacterium]